MKLLIQTILLLCMIYSCIAGVDEKIFNMKYRKTIDSWLIDYVVTQDGYDTCLKLEESCCFEPSQSIKPALVQYQDKKAIQFKGNAKGNCPNNQLIILVYGYNSDDDFTDIYGRFIFLTNIGTSSDELIDNSKNQFLLSIDDQQNIYMLKLPSIRQRYTDIDSYNYLRVEVSVTYSDTIKILIDLLMLILFLL